MMDIDEKRAISTLGQSCGLWFYEHDFFRYLDIYN